MSMVIPGIVIEASVIPIALSMTAVVTRAPTCAMNAPKSTIGVRGASAAVSAARAANRQHASF